MARPRDRLDRGPRALGEGLRAGGRAGIGALGARRARCGPLHQRDRPGQRALDPGGGEAGRAARGGVQLRGLRPARVRRLPAARRFARVAGGYTGAMTMNDEDRERTSMDADPDTPEDPLLRREEEAARREAGGIGGRRPDYEDEQGREATERD